MSQIFDISINSIHGQKNRKCRAISHLRCDLDVAALHGNDLTGKVQSYADALNIMYFFFPVKAFEDDSLFLMSMKTLFCLWNWTAIS